MKRNLKSGEVRVELKYCERCGGLWVREGGGGVYCNKCRIGDRRLADSEEDSGKAQAADADGHGGEQVWSGSSRSRCFRSGSCGRCGMRDTVDWLAAEADESDELLGDQHPRLVSGQDATTRTGNREEQSEDFSQELSEDQNPHFRQNQPEVGHPEEYATRLENDCDYENERVRRIYRARVVTMLRRYLQYSIETGRLPSLLGREFFGRRSRRIP